MEPIESDPDELDSPGLTERPTTIAFDPVRGTASWHFPLDGQPKVTTGALGTEQLLQWNIKLGENRSWYSWLHFGTQKDLTALPGHLQISASRDYPDIRRGNLWYSAGSDEFNLERGYYVDINVAPELFDRIRALVEAGKPPRVRVSAAGNLEKQAWDHEMIPITWCDFAVTVDLQAPSASRVEEDESGKLLARRVDQHAKEIKLLLLAVVVLMVIAIFHR